MSNTAQKFTGQFVSSETDFSTVCAEVLEKFQHSDKVLRASRNTIKIIDFGGADCVMKAFRIPTFPQNYSYGLVATSKAKKSYFNGLKLTEMGILTPEPVGYFEHRSAGKLVQSYYLCANASDLERLDTIWKSQDTQDLDLMRNFANYCYELHRHGVLHRDFNPTNVLVDRTDSKPRFSVVDINRITWYQKLPLSKAMESLSRLPLKGEAMSHLLACYAEVSGEDLSRCEYYLERSVRKTQRYFRNKSRLRKIFPKK